MYFNDIALLLKGSDLFFTMLHLFMTCALNRKLLNIMYFLFSHAVTTFIHLTSTYGNQNVKLESLNDV